MTDEGVAGGGPGIDIEVFQMDSVGTSILGRPRPLSRRDGPTQVAHDGVTQPHPQS